MPRRATCEKSLPAGVDLANGLAKNPGPSHTRRPGQSCFSISRFRTAASREGVTRLAAGRFSGSRVILPPRLPIAITHRDSGILRRSSPVTAARPRPIFTAFPVSPPIKASNLQRRRHYAASARLSRNTASGERKNHRVRRERAFRQSLRV